VPIVFSGLEQMLKCDLCYDRTSEGLKPMCATVCPSQALLYAPKAEISRMRGAQPVREFMVGGLAVKTKNALMVPDPEAPLFLDASLLIEGGL
jgi:Fe-S-cluster-containing dehydrogenase component